MSRTSLPDLKRGVAERVQAAIDSVNQFRRSWHGADYLGQLDAALLLLVAAEDILKDLKKEPKP
jgi:hypothetical protein